MPLSAEMLTAIADGTGYFITLMKIEAVGGDIIRLAVHTRDYEYDGESYRVFPFEPSKFQMKAGTEPDNATIKHILGDAFTRLNLVGGKWAGAKVTVIVVDFLNPDWGYAKKHFGRLGEVTTGGYAAESEFRGAMQLLSQEIGDKTGALCRHQTFDGNCALERENLGLPPIDIADFTSAATVASVDSNQKFTIGALSIPPSHGLLGEYFGGIDDTFPSGSKVAQRYDDTVDFIWSSTPPIFGLGFELYSIRWTGSLVVQYAEAYTFSVEHDDGIRLYIDGVMVIDQWGTPGIHTWVSGALVAGSTHTIKLEFRQNAWSDPDNAYCRLRWSSASQAEQIIPNARLYAPALTLQPDGYFDKGRAEWTGGNNDGLKMEVLRQVGDEITLFLPMVGDIEVGDTVNLIAGDDKSLSTCFHKFNNAVNFGGEDGIPKREDVYHIPD
jgi:hypothetical protein